MRRRPPGSARAFRKVATRRDSTIASVRWAPCSRRRSEREPARNRVPYGPPVPRQVVSGLAALALAVVAGCGGSKPHPSTSRSLSSLDDKLAAPASLRAATPQFALRDSLGHRVRLSQFRGKAVLLTFIYDHCPDTCPLIVGNLHTALVRLGSQAGKVQIVAVSVDPKGDTPKTVNKFLAAHEMTGRMRYLIGSFKQLA